MDQSDIFTLACLTVVQARRAESEQRLLANILRLNQLPRYSQLRTDLVQHNVSFYDLCPADSFERVN
ncbi:MAG: hypothetical protein WA958_06865 [Tunicatimonas sp.]